MDTKGHLGDQLLRPENEQQKLPENSPGFDQ